VVKPRLESASRPEVGAALKIPAASARCCESLPSVAALAGQIPMDRVLADAGAPDYLPLAEPELERSRSTSLIFRMEYSYWGLVPSRSSTKWCNSERGEASPA